MWTTFAENFSMILSFTPFSPVFLTIGPISLHYYGLMYVLAFLFSFFLLPKLAESRSLALSRETTGDFLTSLIFGVLIGGRLGEILFYHPSYYFSHPLKVFAVWEGGMSFHGALIVSILVGIWFAKKHRIPMLKLSDIAAIFLPIGLAFGRLGNFINGELYGRPTTMPWAMNFGDGIPRHPSQLYELGYSLIIFCILFFLRKKTLPDGTFAAMFLAMYGLFRFITEFFREPTTGALQLGWMTMGQLLCIPMFLAGTLWGWWLWKEKKRA